MSFRVPVKTQEPVPVTTDKYLGYASTRTEYRTIRKVNAGSFQEVLYGEQGHIKRLLSFNIIGVTTGADVTGVAVSLVKIESNQATNIIPFYGGASAGAGASTELVGGIGVQSSPAPPAGLYYLAVPPVELRAGWAWVWNITGLGNNLVSILYEDVQVDV